MYIFGISDSMVLSIILNHAFDIRNFMHIETGDSYSINSKSLSK